jgi:hypothetical protein
MGRGSKQTVFTSMRHPSDIGRILVTSSIFALVSPLIAACIYALSPIAGYLMGTPLSTSLHLSLKPFIDFIPTAFAFGLTTYIGGVVGYVGLVHMRFVRFWSSSP